jgi:hypothetical protein
MSEIDPVQFGELRAEVASLRREVDELRIDIKTLLGLVNRSKGGLVVGGSVLATLTSAVTLVVERYLSSR